MAVIRGLHGRRPVGGLLPTVTVAAQNKRKIKSITLPGSDENLIWTQAQDALSIKKPASVPSPETLVFKVVFR